MTIVVWLLGGWNCEQENGSTRGSFETTINVLERLLEYERATVLRWADGAERSSAASHAAA